MNRNNVKSNYKGIVDLNSIELYFDKIIQIVINIDKIKEITTSKGDKMCFITGSDELGIVDIVLFPMEYKKNMDLKKYNHIYLLSTFFFNA